MLCFSFKHNSDRINYMAKVIKLGKKDDIASVIKQIKNLKEKEVIFELEKGSLMLSSSNNLKLMKKTGEVIGKKILVSTDDEIGKILARKAEVLLDDDGVAEPQQVKLGRVKRSDIKPKFGDIRSAGSSRRILPTSTAKTLKSSYIPVIPSVATPVALGKKRGFLSRLRMPSFAKSNFSKAFVFAVAVLLVSAFGVAVLLPQASIIVYARSEPIARDMEIQVDKDVQTTDLTNLRVPGSIMTREVSHTKTFDATGTKVSGTKASGSITLYNFTNNTLTLRASTTTLVANGKNYFFTRDVTGLRPTARTGSGNDQQVEESTLIAPVEIIAENPGQEYNITSTTRFEIRNAALGNNPNVYGENKQAIGGGSALSSKVVSQADLDRAAAELTSELAAQAEADIAKVSGGSTKVLPSGVRQEVLAKTADKNADDEAEQFTMTMIGRVTGLTYSEDDIKDVVVEKINSVLSDDKYLLEGANQQVVARYKTVDLEAGRGVLAVHFETVVAYKVNNDNLSKVLAGKNASEIKEILLTKPEIDRVDVKFAPFFVKKAPRFNGKINISTVLSESE